MHRGWFDGADHYCKDMFLILKYLGTDFLPRLYRVKAAVDRLLERVPGYRISLQIGYYIGLQSYGPIISQSECVTYRETYEHHLGRGGRRCGYSRDS